jgi:hypothetical protein
MSLNLMVKFSKYLQGNIAGSSSPPPKPPMLAVFPARAAVTQSLIAVLSLAVRVLAVSPPVPSFLMAARAGAGMVRAFWSWAPARTLATLVVLRTEAETEEKRTASRARRERGDFMVMIWVGYCVSAKERL